MCYTYPTTKQCLLTNFHAAAIVGMWVVHPKGCKTESTNRNQSETQAQPRMDDASTTCLEVIYVVDHCTFSTKRLFKYFRKRSHLSLPWHVIQQLDSIFCKILHVLNIITKIVLHSRLRSFQYPPFLEATFIKTSNHDLCRQKEFVYRLKSSHSADWLVETAG